MALLEVIIIVVWLIAGLACLFRPQAVRGRTALTCSLALLGVQIAGLTVPAGAVDLNTNEAEAIAVLGWLLQLVGLALLVVAVWPAAWTGRAVDRAEDDVRRVLGGEKPERP